MKIFQDFETPSETTDFVAGKIASIVATAQVRKAPGLRKWQTGRAQQMANKKCLGALLPGSTISSGLEEIMV